MAGKKKEEIKLQVGISKEAHPELYAALLAVNPRQRVSRLRMLATLATVGGNAASRPPVPVSHQNVEATTPAVAPQRKSGIVSALKRNLAQ